MRLSSPLLVLAVDYHQMFKGLTDKAPNFKPAVDQEIAWAKQHLKKQDRITWYLRWIRMNFIWEAEQFRRGMPEGLPPLPAGTFEKELKAFSAKAGKNYTKDDVIRDLPRFKRSLQHYLSLEDADVQRYQFLYQSPMELMTDLEALDKAFQETSEADARMLEPQEGDEPFIKFGNGWAWWALSRGYCPEEAKAMGHCGNQGQVTGDQILSLREPREKGGKNFWEPNLTFIIDKEGYLGEMKGRGNDKPAARYHPYIVSLLKDQRIKGIKGGGYKPSHNFNMNDLNEDSRAELEAMKPELMTLRRYVSKTYTQGASGDVFRRDLYRDPNIAKDQKVVEKTGKLLGLDTSKYNAEVGGWVIEDWINATELVEHKGDKTTQWLMDHVNGNESLNVDDTGYTDKDVLDLIDDLPGPIVQNIGLTLEYEYPDELLEFIEEQGGAEEFTWEPDQDGDVKDFLWFLEHDRGIGTQVMMDLHTSYQYAVESGTSGKMWSDLKAAIQDASDEHDRLKVVWGGDFDSDVVVVVKAPAAIEAAMTCEDEGGCEAEEYGQSFHDELLDNFTVTARERDYSDFDYDTAKDHMKEEYSQPPKNVKKPAEGQPELFPEVYEEPKPAFGTKGITH